MTLYEFLNLHENDYDSYDDKYDAIVTVCFIDEIEDSYDAFCKKIMQKVRVIHTNNNGDPIVNWSELIKKNLTTFQQFTEKYWKRKYKRDIDELIYQWINEINMYLAGYVSDEFYNVLINLVDSLKAV